ncbi:MAG: hypothetical protein SGI72_08930 [Planctomycetota bacterium]|nr:hypothetical protein [Planctomycetota bacterium]
MKQYDDNCAEIENSLPLFVGGDLEALAAGEVASHIERCSACAERERSARAARDVLVSALVSAERKGPDLWPGVRAGLVREGVLQPHFEPSAPLAKQGTRTGTFAPSAAPFASPFASPFSSEARPEKRVRPWHYAAAAAALVMGFWFARDAFDSGAPFGSGTGPGSNENIVENLPPRVIEAQPVVVPVTQNPLAVNTDALHRVGKGERRLREGAEIYSDLPLDQGLATIGERTSTPVVLRR